MIRDPAVHRHMLTAFCLVPGGAHVLELANKIGLDQNHYMTVQQIYRGWALLGALLIAAICVNGVVAVMMRCQTMAYDLRGSRSAVCSVSGLVIFFTWTFPVNQITSNWTCRTGQLADSTFPVGIFARGERRGHVPCAVFVDCIKPALVSLADRTCGGRRSCQGRRRAYYRGNPEEDGQ